MNIYLHVEISARELDSKLLLAVLAASKGHEVVVAGFGEIINGIKTGILKPGIFHTKSLTPGRIKIDRHQKFIDKGFAVTSIDEEGGFLLNNQNSFVKRRFSEKTINQASAVFGWGRDVEILKNNYPKSSSKIFKTGSPRIDLNKPILRDYWLKPKKNPKKPFLLVSSNFTCTFEKPFHEVLKTYRNSGYFERNPELFKIQFKQMSEEYLLLYTFIDAIKKISDNNNFDIVLRPHTREPLEAWKTFLEGAPNVHVIKEEAITPWIKNAFALLHNSCSTAVEAAVAGVPVISYVPFKREYLRKDFANKFGYYVETCEDLIRYINLIFKSYQDGSKDQTVDKSYETLSERVLVDNNELSANKIIKVWESLKINKLSTSNNWIKFYWLCNIISFKRFAQKIMIKLFPNKFKHIKENNKFPSLDKRDILSRVSRLQTILGIKENLQCKFISNKAILIRINKN